MSVSGMYRARPPIVVVKDVVLALFKREMKTRFSGYRLGFAWALIQPISHVLIFCVLFGFKARDGFGGVEMPIFIFTGIVPFLLFQNLYSRCLSACSANKGLFSYRYVKPISAFVARSLLEVAVFLFTASVLLLGFIWFGYDVQIHDPLMCIAVVALLIVYGASLGALAAFCVDYFPEMNRILDLLMKPMLFISGVFYTLDMLPEQYHGYLLWNPVLHTLELFRTYFIAGFATEKGSLEYVFIFTIVSFFLAMLVYRRSWARMIAS